MEVFKVFLEKSFELRLYNKSCVFMTAFMLSLTEAEDATEIWGSKWDTIYPRDAKFFEIILILLTKVVEVYIKFS